jgi:hypothetical protein
MPESTKHSVSEPYGTSVSPRRPTMSDIERLISVLTFRSTNSGIQITTYEGGKTTVDMIIGGRLRTFMGGSILHALQLADEGTFDVVVTVESPLKS